MESAVFPMESNFSCGGGYQAGVPWSMHIQDFCQPGQLTSGLALS